MAIKAYDEIINNLDFDPIDCEIEDEEELVNSIKQLESVYPFMDEDVQYAIKYAILAMEISIPRNVLIDKESLNDPSSDAECPMCNFAFKIGDYVDRNGEHSPGFWRAVRCPSCQQLLVWPNTLNDVNLTSKNFVDATNGIEKTTYPGGDNL